MRRESGIGQEPMEGSRDRGGIVVRHEDPGALGQQFLGVGEARRDHGSAGGECLHQDPRDDLLARSVRQEHDVGFAYLPEQRGRVVVRVVELDV